MVSCVSEWWRWNVLAYYYALIAGWRLISGRYFVFRDLPDWFVEARDEWHLRLKAKNHGEKNGS